MIPIINPLESFIFKNLSLVSMCSIYVGTKSSALIIFYFIWAVYLDIFNSIRFYFMQHILLFSQVFFLHMDSYTSSISFSFIFFFFTLVQFS